MASSSSSSSAPHDAGGGKYDEVLMRLAAQHGGVEPLLRTFFSFLHRKTDFYVTFPAGTPNAPMGFPPGAAEQILLKNFRAFPYKPLGGGGGASSSSSSSARPQQPPARPAATAPSSASSSLSSSASSSSSSSSLAPASTTPTTAAAKPKSEAPSVQYTAEGKQVPVGNGGVTERYYWTQTLQEATVYIAVPAGTKAKDVACDWTPGTLRVRVQGSVVLEGDLPGPIGTGDSLWTIEKQGGGSGGGAAEATLILTLEKAKTAWWSCVVKGDPEIDTAQVDSRAQVGDFDGETQGAIRKIMFDQQQKARGLPTSDELQMQELLEKAKSMPGSPFPRKTHEGGGSST